MLHNAKRSPAGAFRRLDAYMEETRELLSTGSALCVVRGDAVVHEAYGGRHGAEPGSRPIDAASQFHLASVRKTYLGFAVSLAIEEGRIASLDDAAADYLEDAGEVPLEGITLRHLLTHTHGLRRGGEAGREFPPGTGWSYNNSGVNLLIRIVARVFGKPPAEVLRERVFRPLGFARTDWRAERTEELVWMDEAYGTDDGSEANLFANARELAYWGALHLNGGGFAGVRIAPRRVFERAAAVASPEGLPARYPRNGFLWQVQAGPSERSELGPSLPAGAFQSLGVYGSAVLVLPSHGAAAVRMLNGFKPNPPGYDYLADIRRFGDLVLEALECASMKG
ncbi:beta-lactamase family protein [Paenibacillus sp. MWE-103]|uniref:Beta-lactamase family protein n=1 Tax=Paenibacillus artemisiicola TaxID=1172618 RepID=A0ABS3W8Y3_9BACL|nr:serine hydrolase domain-containing protein [Paenibacillus artemisiicola]MBO7744771.1 beta-lactamase family protein [Paenibacillus artemisiicola]